MHPRTPPRAAKRPRRTPLSLANCPAPASRRRATPVVRGAAPWPRRPTSPSSTRSSPVFRAHEGGKLGVHATQPLRDRATCRCSTRPASPRSPARSRPTRRSPRATRAAATPSPSISDGTAVLGLGDIGPLAAMPVMEGKAVLFKHFAGVDAVPVCMETGHRRRAGRRHRPDRADLRRHQPRGHLGAALLRDRAPAPGAARHPGLPRRPARHGDRRAGRLCSTPRRWSAATLADLRGRRLRRRGRRRRRDQASCRGPASRDVVVVDSRGIISPDAPGPRRAQAAELAASTNPRGRARPARRRPSTGPTSSSASPAAGAGGARSRRWRRDAHGLRARQPRPRGAPGRRPPVRRGRGHRPLGLPEPDQQRAGLPRHLPRRPGLPARPRSPRR